MDRKKFLTTAGLVGVATTIGTTSLLGKSTNKKENNQKLKEKIVNNTEGQKLNVLGDNQSIKLNSTDTGGQITTIYQDNVPGTQIPKHLHTKEDEIFRLVEGEVEFEVGDRETTLKSGDMIFLPKNIPHSFKVEGTANAKVYLDIIPAGIEKMFKELSKLPAGPPDFLKVSEICRHYGLKFV